MPGPGERRPSFYLPALQFLLAVALLGYVLFVTIGDIPSPDTPGCPPDESDPGNLNGCPVIFSSSWSPLIYGSQYQVVLVLFSVLALLAVTVMVTA